MDATDVASFWSRVEMTDTCWPWMGTTSTGGYGSVSIKGKTYRTHRLAYELAKGSVPAGLVLDHLCHNPCCVNPDHLEPVTNQENVLRGIGPSAQHAKKTHCVRGHELTPDNLYTRPTRKWRECRQCRDIYIASRQKLGDTRVRCFQCMRWTAKNNRHATDERPDLIFCGRCYRLEVAKSNQSKGVKE